MRPLRHKSPNLRVALQGQNSERLPTGPLPSRDVPEASEDGQKHDDFLSTYSSRTASYDRLMLDALLTKIRRARKPYVGIMATDVSDLIFLAGKVRENSPDSMLFTISSDLRILRQSVNPDLYGTLVFSTYQLYPGNAGWIRFQKNPFPFTGFLRDFPSETAEGIYIAAFSALNPSQHKALEQKRHILWTSVVGHDQLWPISFQSFGLIPNIDTGGLVRACTHYRLFVVLIFLILLLSSLMVAVARAPLRTWIESTGPGGQLTAGIPTFVRRLTEKPDSDAFDDAEAKKQRHADALALGLLATILIGASYLLLPQLRLHDYYPAYHPAWPTFLWWYCLPLLLTAICFAALATAIVLNINQFQDDIAHSRWSLLTYGVLVLTGVFAVWQLHLFDQSFVPLVFMRSVNWNSGVSPLKVLCFLGLAGFLLNWCHLQQANLLEDSDLPPSGFLGFIGTSFSATSSFQVVGYYERNLKSGSKQNSMSCPAHEFFSQPL
jgi:hypothetical protein